MARTFFPLPPASFQKGGGEENKCTHSILNLFNHSQSRTSSVSRMVDIHLYSSLLGIYIELERVNQPVSYFESGNTWLCYVRVSRSVVLLLLATTTPTFRLLYSYLISQVILHHTSSGYKAVSREDHQHLHWKERDGGVSGGFSVLRGNDS